MKKAIITVLAVLTIIVTAMAPAAKMDAKAAADQTSTMNARLLADINNLRAEQGLPALTLDSELNSYAAVRSEEINTVWSHTRPNGTSGADMISSTKWKTFPILHTEASDFQIPSRTTQQTAYSQA